MTFSSQNSSLTLSDFDFVLPEDRIATCPAAKRDAAKLLHVRKDGFGDHHVADLPSLLRPGDLLVANDTKVIPARLYGLRGEVKIEILLNHHLQTPDTESCVWDVLARPAKRLRQGDKVIFSGGIEALVEERLPDGQVRLRFLMPLAALFAALERFGHVPLPPYIKRPEGDTADDKKNYQTVYAAHEGAVAAPTAGLHFTPELLAALEAKDIRMEKVTLHVGAGTFLPVKCENVKDHVMHSEWGHLSEAAAQRINQARKDGRRIVAVGTTSTRLLETVADPTGHLVPFAGETDIFITPGVRFKIVDALMTNFHLPKSTLFMLVSAFAGRERMKAAYAHAIENNYRFYSFGDASLLEKAP